MNIFTTDHPLHSVPLHSDSKKAALFSYFGHMLSVALVLCPFFVGFYLFVNLADNHGTTDYTPDPIWVVMVGAVIESLFVAFVCVSLHRLVAWFFRKFRKKRLTYAA